MPKDVPVTGISEPPDDWPGRHLKQEELRWFDFDPSGLAEFVRRYGSDPKLVDPGLADRIMECRRAAWRCGSWVLFTQDVYARRQGVLTAVVSNDEHSGNFQEYGIDVDPNGSVLGVCRQVVARTLSRSLASTQEELMETGRGRVRGRSSSPSSLDSRCCCSCFPEAEPPRSPQRATH